MAKVAVLHTSFVFVTVEPVITDLISELIPDVEVLHFVDSGGRPRPGARRPSSNNSAPVPFDVLMAGDRTRHDRMIADQAAVLVREVDVIVLAQASMNRLVAGLESETGLKVLSSPRSGVENLAQIVREQTEVHSLSE